MSLSCLQMHLWKDVIIVPDMNLPAHSFSHGGIQNLNSFNIDVQIEGVYNKVHSHSPIFWPDLKIKYNHL